MSHTPGPWGFKAQDGSGHPDSPYIIGQQSAIDDDDGYWVAEVTAGVPDELSDALLIAAAPELLDFVQLVIDAGEQGITLRQLQQVAKEILDRATGPTEGGI